MTDDRGAPRRAARAPRTRVPRYGILARSRRTAAPDAGSERGSAMVETALVLPMILMLTFGMLTGGIAWDRNQSLTHAAREGTRYGATLPFDGATIEQWLDEVASVAVANADGNLNPSVDSRYLCVAFVDGTDDTRRVQEGGAGPTYESGGCFSDDLEGARVQTVTQRTSDLSAMLVNRELTLRRTALAQFEAGP